MLVLLLVSKDRRLLVLVKCSQLILEYSVVCVGFWKQKIKRFNHSLHSFFCELYLLFSSVWAFHWGLRPDTNSTCHTSCCIGHRKLFRTRICWLHYLKILIGQNSKMVRFSLHLRESYFCSVEYDCMKMYKSLHKSCWAVDVNRFYRIEVEEGETIWNI